MGELGNRTGLRYRDFSPFDSPRHLSLMQMYLTCKLNNNEPLCLWEFPQVMTSSTNTVLLRLLNRVTLKSSKHVKIEVRSFWGRNVFLNGCDWIAIAHNFPSDSILVDNARTLCLPCMTHCSFSRIAKSCVRGPKEMKSLCIVLTSRPVLRWCRCTPPNSTFLSTSPFFPKSFKLFESSGPAFMSRVYQRLVSHMLSIICLSFTWNLWGVCR